MDAATVAVNSKPVARDGEVNVSKLVQIIWFEFWSFLATGG